MYDVLMTLFVTAFFVLVGMRLYYVHLAKVAKKRAGRLARIRSIVAWLRQERPPPEASPAAQGAAGSADGALGAREGGGARANQLGEVRETDAGRASPPRRGALRAGKESRSSQLGNHPGRRFPKETAAQNIFILLDAPPTTISIPYGRGQWR